MHPADINPVQAAELIRRSLLLADRAVVADIEGEAAPTDHRGARWLDIRPMLSPHEHAPQVLDMAAEALAYARMRGLIEHHAEHSHLVRVLRRSS